MTEQPIETTAQINNEPTKPTVRTTIRTTAVRPPKTEFKPDEVRGPAVIRRPLVAPRTTLTRCVTMYENSDFLRENFELRNVKPNPPKRTSSMEFQQPATLPKTWVLNENYANLPSPPSTPRSYKSAKSNTSMTNSIEVEELYQAIRQPFLIPNPNKSLPRYEPRHENIDELPERNVELEAEPEPEVEPEPEPKPKLGPRRKSRIYELLKKFETK
jgi:hypothetical protein